ncbi:MAG TPA: hypothetical protein VIK61_12405, partial [Acidimicrobiia bacterium]
MSIKRLAARLAKLEAPIRDHCATTPSPPADTREAFILALDSGQLTQEHFEAMWQEHGPRWRDETIQRARARRVTRLTPGHEENFRVRLDDASNPLVAVVEIASHHPNETLNPQYMRCLEVNARDPIEHLWPETKPSRPFLTNWLHAQLALRVLGSDDGLELRKQI